MNKKKMRVGEQIKAQKGITLIALIITIIVMLILVTVTITVAINGGLFNYAKKAKVDTEAEMTKEQMLAAGMVCVDGFWYNSMDDYINGIYSENQIDAKIKLTYFFGDTDPSNFAIYLTLTYDDYIEYETYATIKIKEMENSITDKTELRQEKEKILLEGINLNWEGYTGKTFEKLQDFVDYMNEDNGTSYDNIYALMAGWNGNNDDDTDNQILNDFLVNQECIKKDDYYNTYVNFIITKPDGTKENVQNNSQIAYIASTNGNFTFKAENESGKDKTATTIKIKDIVEEYTIDEKFSNIYDATTIYTDKNGDTAYIPKGFAVGVESINTVINTIEDGLVITSAIDSNGHSTGNEFVWVPVEIQSTDTETNITAMERTEWKNNEPTNQLKDSYTEPYTDGYTNEDTEYYAMLKSVYKYGGFYIGRYEAGTSVKRTSSTNGTWGGTVVKKGYYPYNNVGWGYSMTDYKTNIIYQYRDKGPGAVYVSKNFSTVLSDAITSTLIYGSQWDATLRFIKDEVNVTEGLTWGNIYKSSFRFIGASWNGSKWEEQTAKAIKPYNKSVLLTTGASESNKSKNIYDLTGNVKEWTMEADSTKCRVTRGGDYSQGAGAGTRQSIMTGHGIGSNVGFRISLYINVE